MSELRSYQFPVTTGRGVLLGLSGPQLIGVAACGVVFVAAVSAGGAAALAVGAGVIVVLLAGCFVPVGGRPAVEWLPVWASFGWAMATRNNEFYASPDLTGTVLPDGTLDLPGELFGLELHEYLPPAAAAVTARVANPAPAGYGLVRDTFRDRLVAVVELSGPEFLFGDPAEQQAKISSWGTLLDHVAQSIPELSRLQLVHTVGPSSAEALAAYHRSHGGRGNQATAGSYRQVLARCGTAAQDHRCLLAVALDTKLARRAIRQAGGGLAGGGAVLLDRAAVLEQGLQAAGVDVVGWLPARSIAQLLRVGFDPDARRALSDRPGDVNDGGGTDPALAGPSGMVDGWSAVRHDSGWSTTLQVVAAPTRPVTGDFLQHLLIGVPAQRRMSLLYVPTGMREAERRAQSEQTVTEAEQALRARWGFAASARHRRQHADAARREQDLVEGRAVYRLVWTITVTARSPGELDQAAGQVETAARRCGLELRRLVGTQRQAACFTLPVCRGSSLMARRDRRLRPLVKTSDRSQTRSARAELASERRARRETELTERRALLARYRGVGGRRGQRRPLAGRIAWQTRPEAMEVSAGTLEAAYPFQVASGTGHAAGRGLVIGPSPTGGTFTWDPWVLYQQGRLTNPNVLILGDVGSGKSTLAKSLIWRGLEFGRGAHIIDPKGEYGPLAAAVGVDPVRLAPGTGTVLNPLDPGVAGRRLAPTALFHRNLATLRALIEATLGRPCRQLELVVLTAALARISGLELHGTDRVETHGQTATLLQLAEALIDPPDQVAKRANMPAARVLDESREMALAIGRLVDPHGDLGGMFAGPTNLDADALADLTVVDVAEIYRTSRASLPLVMICTAAWLQLATDLDARGRWQLNDEGWALMADEATARWTQTNQKLARQLGISVVNVLHRLSDTAAAGPAGSTTRALAEGVIADSGTWILHRQPPSEQHLLTTTLGLNQMQAVQTTRLPRGRGLWIVGGEQRQVALVDHLLSDTERHLVDTDQAMHAPDQPTAP